MKYKILIITFFIIAASVNIFCQGSAGESYTVESRYIVDMPTAGVITKNSFAIYSIVYPGGGIMTEITAAPFTNFNMGICYSGANIIGDGEVVWQGVPGVHLRYRLLDEEKMFPAILAGISTQGRGSFIKDSKRFETMSPGLFASSSKSFNWLTGLLALHFGINYSFEPPTSSRAPNMYFGLEQTIGKSVSIAFEYNANIDDKNRTFMDKRGLLNFALRISAAKGLTFELQARDMLKHKNNVEGFTRFVGFEFVGNY